MLFSEMISPIVVMLSDITSSTTGIGVGIISTSYFSLIYAPKNAVLLGLYVFTLSNMFIISRFKKHIDTKFLIKFVPLTVPGIIAGTIALSELEGSTIRFFFGALLLAIIILTINGTIKIVHAKEKYVMALFASIIGFASAFMNASSPFMVLLLLSLGYSKKELVATATAVYFINNLIKLVSFYYVGLASAEMAQMSLYYIPFIIAGILLGKSLIEKVSAEALRTAILILLSILAFGLILGY